jgi:hypothetical protein
MHSEIYVQAVELEIEKSNPYVFIWRRDDILEEVAYEQFQRMSRASQIDKKGVAYCLCHPFLMRQHRHGQVYVIQYGCIRNLESKNDGN